MEKEYNIKDSTGEKKHYFYRKVITILIEMMMIDD